MPAPGNPLGVRGGGEGGTTPALGVVVNAVVDALAEFGVTHIEMPVTPGARLARDPYPEKLTKMKTAPRRARELIVAALSSRWIFLLLAPFSSRCRIQP